MTIRHVSMGDTPILHDIFAYYVINFPYSFDYEVPLVEEFSERIAETVRKYPFFVCEDDIYDFCLYKPFIFRYNTD